MIKELVDWFSFLVEFLSSNNYLPQTVILAQINHLLNWLWFSPSRNIPQSVLNQQSRCVWGFSHSSCLKIHYDKMNVLIFPPDVIDINCPFPAELCLPVVLLHFVILYVFSSLISVFRISGDYFSYIFIEFLSLNHNLISQLHIS